MTYVKICAYLFLFLLMGELVVRFDRHFQPFGDSNTVKAAIQLGESEELRLLSNGALPDPQNDLRVMVLGDSYIHGAGINPDNSFSNQLRSLLKSTLKDNRNVYILDVSRPSNNTLDNYLTYFKYVNEFKPNVVVLAYNLNDINGHLELPVDSSRALPVASTAPMGKGVTSDIKKAYSVLYKSALVEMVMKSTNKQLKSMGYVVPGSKFDQELKSYYTNAPAWARSKELLGTMLADAAQRNARFVAYLMPEMDLLKSPDIFNAADSSIQHFFTDSPAVTFINGRNLFERGDAAAYRLSKYDGHPNEKAHTFLANHSYNLILELENQLASHQP